MSRTALLSIARNLLLGALALQFGAAIARSAGLQAVEGEVAPPAVRFSGYEFAVKTCPGCGPGPNVFSAEAVRVDPAGRLHLTITRAGGHWACGEVVLNHSLGYGEYRVKLRVPADFDPAAVFGFFTWDPTARDLYYREFDFELSQWGQSGDPNSQMVLQPFGLEGNRVRFRLTPGPVEVSLKWSPGLLLCRAFLGGHLVQQHRFTVGVPATTGGERLHFNCWLYGSTQQPGFGPAEVVLDRFTFVPLRKGK